MKRKAKSRLSTVLKKYHTGMEQSITGKELEHTLGIRKDTVQKLVRQLRADGVPICSSSCGYFYAETRQELTETAARFNKSISTMMKTQRKLLDTTPDEKEKIVMVVPQEGVKLSLNIQSLRRG